MENLISKKLKSYGFVIAFLTTFFLLPSVSAETTDEATLNQRIDAFQSQLNVELNKANEVYAKAQTSQKQVQEMKDKTKSIENEVRQTQKDISNLKEKIAHQMRSIQSSGDTFTSVLNLVASSEDFSDLVSRLTNYRLILEAEAQQTKNLQEKEESLREMTSNLEKAKADLLSDQKEYESQVSDLQSNISDLKAKISSNQGLLAEMEQKAAADKAEREKALAESVNRTESKNKDKVQGLDSQNPSNSGKEKPAPPVLDKPSSGGRQLLVEATAYALNGITAMGIDLSKNPMCIAVDPSVIPLGSMIEVPGYGIAVAGDTGGAIIGNIIDVHFPTEAQAIAWGRQMKTITIIS